MCVPVHTSKFSKEQLLSSFLPCSTESVSDLQPPSLSSKMEEYSDLKQHLSLFLPHHLLTKTNFSQQIHRSVW